MIVPKSLNSQRKWLKTTLQLSQSNGGSLWSIDLVMIDRPILRKHLREDYVSLQLLFFNDINYFLFVLQSLIYFLIERKCEWITLQRSQIKPLYDSSYAKNWTELIKFRNANDRQINCELLLFFLIFVRSMGNIPRNL